MIMRVHFLMLLVAGMLIWREGVVEAQIPQNIVSLIAGLPTCSLSCLSTALANEGCAIGEQACSCGTKKANIQADAIPCIEAACDAADIAMTRNITVAVCNIYSESISNSQVSSTSITTALSSTITPVFTTTGGARLSSSVLATQTSSLPSVSSTLGAHASVLADPATQKSAIGLTSGAKAGIGIAAAFGGVVLLAALILCIMGQRRRKKDLGHLKFIEKRGVVRGRTELDAGNVVKDVETPTQVPSEMGESERQVGQRLSRDQDEKKTKVSEETGQQSHQLRPGWI